MGFALLTSAMNQPFGFPGEYDGNATLNPGALSMELFLEEKVAEEGVQPILMFESLFFALFGAAGVKDLQA